MTPNPGATAGVDLKVAPRLALLLCIEDEVHDLAYSWLTEAGMRVTSVSSGPDAAKQISENRIGLLVLDTLPIYLPGLPSLQALKGERPHLHVILIPRLDEKPEPGVARISGVDATLVRPLSKSKLLSVVDTLG